MGPETHELLSSRSVDRELLARTISKERPDLRRTTSRSHPKQLSPLRGPRYQLIYSPMPVKGRSDAYYRNAAPRPCPVCGQRDGPPPTRGRELTRDASSINRIYREKLDKVKKADVDGDWGKYVCLHERPYRLDALLSATKKGLKKKPPEFWALVGDVWQDSENVHQSLSKWKRLWDTAIEGRKACMSAEDIRIFDCLPEQTRGLARHELQT